MNLSAHRARSRRRSVLGFTLAEMMVATTISIVLATGVVAFTMNTVRNYTAMGNYVDLDDTSRNALDTLSRKIRNASALTSFSTNSPMSLSFTNSTSGTSFTLTYDSTARTLSMTQPGQPSTTLLTQCDQWNFALYDKAPNTNYPAYSTNITFYVATNSTGAIDPTFCKLINMTWKCSRQIFAQKVNTESVQTAQIVLRNKTQ